LLCGEALDPPGDLIDGQRVVVGGLKRAKDGGPKLGLAGGLLALAEDLVGLLGGLLGYPKPLPCDLLGYLQSLPGYLLGGLKPLLGGPLEGPHALLGVGEGREEGPVGPHPLLRECPVPLLLLAYAASEFSL
jgi:hypothetical protein